jgi:hypothetical protein
MSTEIQLSSTFESRFRVFDLSFGKEAIGIVIEVGPTGAEHDIMTLSSG